MTAEEWITAQVEALKFIGGGLLTIRRQSFTVIHCNHPKYRS